MAFVAEKGGRSRTAVRIREARGVIGAVADFLPTEHAGRV